MENDSSDVNVVTWHFLSPLDPAENDIPDEWVWERLRNRRNALLAECDWRVVIDASWDTAPWIEYRKALRDLPDATSDPRSAVWPTSPEGN